METLRLSTTLRLDDWQALARATQVRLGQRSALGSIGIMLSAGLVTVIALHVLERFGLVPDVLGLTLGAALTVVCFALLFARQRRAWRPDEDGFFLGEFELELGPDGIRSRHRRGESQILWSALRGLTCTSQHVFLWVDRLSAVVVPRRDLPETLTAESLMSSVREWAIRSGVSAATLNDESSQAEARQYAASADASSANAGPSAWRTASALFVPNATRNGRLVPTEGGILLLTALTIALWIGVDRVSRTGEPEFLPSFGAGGIAWYLLVGLGLAWVAARSARPQVPFKDAAWAVASLAPVCVLLQFLSGRALLATPSWAWIGLLGSPLVLAALLARALRIVSGARHWRAVASTLCVALVVGALQQSVYRNASVWLPTEESSSDDADSTDIDPEALLYAQPSRIDAALAALAPRDAGGPNAFMVGFAGVGEQRVFAEEIDLAARVLGQRYGSASRTLLLVNDRRDFERRPLATVTNLRHALRGVAGHMDVEKDVLFLVLSSHGSDDPEISVSNDILPLNGLSGAALANALRESGIRWKVVIISACHAGAFIPALRDERTIVLTAAAADRASFGCSDDRDLTYFGEALLRDALPNAESLTAAFAAAQRALAERERKEGITPSLPQAHVGAEMAAHLKALDRGPLQGTTPARPAAQVAHAR